MRYNVPYGILLLIFSLILPGSNSWGGGISVDGGLTPAQSRWVMRAQMRVFPYYATTDRQQLSRVKYQWPLVLAYGLMPELTVMARQSLIHQQLPDGRSVTGLDNPFLFAKYKLFRLNKPGLILGASPGVGVSIPVGHRQVASGTWDLRGGLFLSGRKRMWSADVNLIGQFRDVPGSAESSVVRGHQYKVNVAVARHFVLGGADKTLAPVLEVTGVKKGPNRLQGQQLSGTSSAIVYASPGLKLTISSTVLEALVQIPVWQRNRLQSTRGLVGGRLKF